MKKIILTPEELEHIIEQAFVHGQGDNGWQTEEEILEDYTGSVMRRLTNQNKDE